MGCFDTIRLECPECGSEYFAQSKGGDCTLSLYDLKTCPPDVMSDANRHAPYDCEKCGCIFAVDIETQTVYTLKEV